MEGACLRATVLARLDALLVVLSDGAPLTEERMYELCDECLATKVAQPLIRALGEAFTQPAILSKCFSTRAPQATTDRGKTGGEIFHLCIFLMASLRT